uniref:Secreted protein n=1 Tax=Rhipicephalus appendiculatus TaxID=34631 RepID=A0A131YGW8_RHIAP
MSRTMHRKAYKITEIFFLLLLYRTADTKNPCCVRFFSASTNVINNRHLTEAPSQRVTANCIRTKHDRHEKTAITPKNSTAICATT